MDGWDNMGEVLEGVTKSMVEYVGAVSFCTFGLIPKVLKVFNSSARIAWRTSSTTADVSEVALLDVGGCEASPDFISRASSSVGLSHVLFFFFFNGHIYHPGSHWGSRMAAGGDLVCFCTF